MSVTRYELKTKYRGNESWDDLEESPDGMYVSYQDYEKLAAENAGMKSAISNTQGAIELACAGINDDRRGCVFKDILNAVYMKTHSETQNTDAFLAEVRAQGVEMFAQWCRGERDFTLIDEDMSDAAAYEECVKRAEYFAAQIRKGVQS
ncbi:hypothetical protein [Enterobacter sp. 168J2]|uniref:hypothetical protein n=1 Tax=Enterobacter sp. 168J2 TaxID=3077758 RepID=UPI001249E877|nr:hypothetical protein [Enterobacter sp. 168J2]HBU6131240.1 hypothetical protein [Enterobacter cloacae]